MQNAVVTRPFKRGAVTVIDTSLAGETLGAYHLRKPPGWKFSALIRNDLACLNRR